MIFWDIDGVLRNLCLLVWGKDPEEWEAKIGNLSLTEYVSLHLGILLIAPATEYAEVARKTGKIHILSHQEGSWKYYTERWLKNHDLNFETITYVARPDCKINFLRPGDWLVDDYPFFPDYSQVILIDHSYNRSTNAPIRIKEAKELKKILKEVRND